MFEQEEMTQIGAHLAFDPKEFIDHLATVSRPDGQVADENADPPIGRMCLAFKKEEAIAMSIVRETALRMASKLPVGDASWHEDAIGNGIFEIKGTDPLLPAVVVISHVDSVKNGGKYDGLLGIAAGFVVADQLVVVRRPRRTFKLIATVAEESGTTGLSCIGSRFLTRAGSVEALGRVRYESTTLAEHLGEARMMEIARAWQLPGLTAENTKAALELHIEQSHLIALRGLDMAVVSNGIGGSWRQVLRAPVKRVQVDTTDGSYEKCTLRFLGKPAHTGAMPPNPALRGGTLYRKDALVAACDTTTGLLKGVDIALIAVRSLSENGFTIVPHDQEVQLLVRHEEVERLTRALVERVEHVRGDFGVEMTFDFTALTSATVSVSVCEEASAKSALDIPLAVKAFSHRAFLEELEQNADIGLTRTTVTDFDVGDTCEAKLDGRDFDTAAGTRLRTLVEEHLTASGVTVDTVSITPYSPVDEELSARVVRIAEQTLVNDGDSMRPLRVGRMPSGPGHDLGRLLDKRISGALIFVRQENEDETSHSPRERAEWLDINRALRPFAQAVMHELNS